MLLSFVAAVEAGLFPDERLARIFVRYRVPEQDGTESLMIISCANAIRVVMHYYERGNFSAALGRDAASQKPGPAIGSGTLSARSKREKQGAAVCVAAGEGA